MWVLFGSRWSDGLPGWPWLALKAIWTCWRFLSLSSAYLLSEWSRNELAGQKEKTRRHTSFQIEREILVSDLLVEVLSEGEEEIFVLPYFRHVRQDSIQVLLVEIVGHNVRFKSTFDWVLLIELQEGVVEVHSGGMGLYNLLDLLICVRVQLCKPLTLDFTFSEATSSLKRGNMSNFKRPQIAFWINVKVVRVGQRILSIRFYTAQSKLVRTITHLLHERILNVDADGLGSEITLVNWLSHVVHLVLVANILIHLCCRQYTARTAYVRVSNQNVKLSSAYCLAKKSINLNMMVLLVIHSSSDDTSLEGVVTGVFFLNIAR